MLCKSIAYEKKSQTNANIKGEMKASANKRKYLNKVKILFCVYWAYKIPYKIMFEYIIIIFVPSVI